MGNRNKKNMQKQDKSGTRIDESAREGLDFSSTELEINTPKKRTLANNDPDKNSMNNNDSDSDSEVQRKKPKRKKKPIVPSENTGGTGKKNIKSIRQMKKEKHAQRQAEAASIAKDQMKNQCLSYLSQWKHDRQNWRFMKTKQIWLFKNKFSKNLIPENSWPLLLEYFDSAQGNIRKNLLDDANKIIKQMDDWTELQDKNNIDNENEETDETNLDKPDDAIYNRARSLIQCLQE